MTAEVEKMPELLPCPFCGGDARVNKTWSPDYNGKGKAFYWVSCKRSTCEGKSGHRSTKNMAAVKWNTRADLAYPVTKEAAQAALEAVNDWFRSINYTRNATNIKPCKFVDGEKVLQEHGIKILALLEAASK
jgi:hypothetical protein